MTQPNQYEDKELRSMVHRLIIENRNSLNDSTTNEPYDVKGIADDVITLITQKQLEARRDERILAKGDVLKLRNIYLSKDTNGAGGIDPMADYAIKVRANQREEIIEDFDARIAEITKQEEKC